MTRALPLLVLALSLAACGGDKKQQGAGTAEGEVLPGTVSDAMLPLDTVTSQPPLAPKSPSSSQDPAVKDKAAEAAATSSEPASAPAAVPTEAAEPAPQ